MKLFNIEIIIRKINYKTQLLDETEVFASKLLEKAKFTLAHQKNLQDNYADTLNEHQLKGITNAITQAEHDILNYQSQLEVINKLK